MGLHNINNAEWSGTLYVFKLQYIDNEFEHFTILRKLTWN